MASSAAQFFSGTMFSGSQLFSAPEKKYKNAVCIAIDVKGSRFYYYSMDEGQKSSIKQDNREFSAKPFSAEFIIELTEAVRGFSAHRTSLDDTSVTLVLPDSAVSMDTVNIPNMNRKRNEEAIEATISGLYKNLDDLILNKCLTVQNKQVVTYSLAIANREVIMPIVKAVEEGGMKPTHITFAANCRINAVAEIVPKLKNASYVLCDIKENNTVVSFSAGGKTVGFYSLPFGYNFLVRSKVMPEDMLFNHPVAELAVLNAREKARAKQLTMMGGENGEDGEQSEEDKLNSMFGGDDNYTVDPTAGTTAVTIKTLPKKVPRKLPKFMLRPEPTNEEETAYENFRIYMKWVLNLIETNIRLTSQGKPEAVYVNMPEELNFLFEKVNEEKEENGIEFMPIEVGSGRKDILESLELYGALFANLHNKNNNFTV